MDGSIPSAPTVPSPSDILAAAHAQQQPQIQPAQPQHSGNWLTHLLPTIGGVGGSLLGGILTAGLGGEVAGGAGGAALGKTIENALEGKQALQANDLTAGLEGGIGTGIGGVAGKLIGGVAGKLGGAAENIAAKEASQNAAQDAIDTRANIYGDLSKQLQQRLGAEDSLNHVTKMGYDIADPANLVHVGQTSNDTLNAVLDKALAEAGPVDLSHYPQLIKDALTKESGTLGSFDKVALARGRLGYGNSPAAQLLQRLESLGSAPGETTGTAIAKVNADPNEIRTLTTKLGQLAKDAKPTVTATTGAVDPTQSAIYNVINEVRGNVKNALYDRPELNDIITKQVGNFTPEDVGTQELSDHLNNIISQAGTKGSKTAAQDLLDEISNNIDIKDLGKAAQDSGQIVTSRAAKARMANELGLNEPEVGGNPALDAVGVLANPHAGMVKTVINAGAHVAKNPAILSTLSRIGALGEKIAPPVGAALATSPNLAADPVTGAPMAAGGTMGGTMNNGAINGNDLQTYVRAMEAQSVLNPNSTSGEQFMASVFPLLQKNQLLSSEINGMPTLYANAGGAQGIGGILSRLTGLIPGTAAHTYEAQQNDVAHQLGINPNMLPSLMQNGNTAGLSGNILANLQSHLAY